MAIDEALARGCARRRAPTLRFYDWKRPTLSLGRHQRLVDAADEAACRRMGVEIVRRPSGGRAVLHESEITYALTVPATDPLAAGGTRCALAGVARALARGLQHLGVPARVAGDGDFGPGRGRAPIPPCFLSAAREEIVADGEKVGAAAQWRLRDALLQHGSIPLHIDRERLSAATGLGRRPGQENGWGRFPTGLGRWAQADRNDWIGALVAGFEEELGVRLVRGRLTRREIDRARRLERRVYAAASWTRRL